MESNGTIKLYQIALSFLLGVISAGGTVFIATQKDTIARREFAEQNARVEEHLRSTDAMIQQVANLEQKNAMQIGMLIEDMRLGVRPSIPARKQ